MKRVYFHRFITDIVAVFLHIATIKASGATYTAENVQPVHVRSGNARERKCASSHGMSGCNSVGSKVYLKLRLKGENIHLVGNIQYL